MNHATYERAQVAAFAYNEARYTGQLECMRAICFVLRNRVKAGWGDGSWLSVLETSWVVAGNEPRPSKPEEPVSSTDRLLQLIVRDVDDIYLGQDRLDDDTRRICLGDNPPKTAALYYAFVDRPIRDWFQVNIIRETGEHPHMGNIGTMMLFR